MSFLRRVFERRDLGWSAVWTAGQSGLSVPSNWESGGTVAGVSVTETTALGVVAYNACVQLIADSIAGLPWDSYRRQGDRRIEVDPQPPLLREPSSDMTVFDWKHMVVVSLLMRGNFYGLVVERDQLEYPTSIWPLHPDQVRIDRDPETFEKRVWVNGKRYPIRDLFHIPAFRMPGSDVGLSPIGMHRHSLGLSLASSQFGSSWFNDGAAPSSVLETDQTLTPTQVRDTQRQWIASHAGRRRPAVLSGGFKWRPITITPEESQFLQTRQYQALEACQMLRVPPHMIAIVDKSTSWGTGIEQQSIGFVTYTLKSWLDRIESALNRITPRGQYVKFNVNGLLRGDSASRLAFYKGMWDMGAFNTDEVRAHEDLPPVEGGDVRYRPLNMGRLGEVDSPVSETPNEPTPTDLQPPDAEGTD